MDATEVPDIVEVILRRARGLRTLTLLVSRVYRNCIGFVSGVLGGFWAGFGRKFWAKVLGESFERVFFFGQKLYRVQVRSFGRVLGESFGRVLGGF